MKARVLLRRAAELDLAGIEDWYESQQAGLGSQFRGAVEALLARISDKPAAFPERYRGIRRAIMPRFPYVIWYQLQGSSVVVLACVHGRRDPRVARARLREGA